MWATIGWLVLLGLSVAIEAASRLRAGSTATLARLGAVIATRVSGRVVLILLWVFVGLHLFARYTIPGH
jgi:high-affinity nickel permease